MINLLLDDHIEMIGILLKHNVEFMLVGGYAVVHYGYDRTTGDMDLWLNIGNKNRDKFIAALHEFGIEDEQLTILKEMDFTNPVPVIYFGEAPRRIDFVTMISNVKFDKANEHVNYVEWEELKIPIIHFNDLILSKITSARPKDKADVEELQRIAKNRKK